MNRVRRDPLSAALTRAIAACARSAAPVVELEVRPWASATFVGAVHRFAIELPGDEAAVLAETLAAHEFALTGHIVADINSARELQPGGAARLEIEVLTVEE